MHSLRTDGHSPAPLSSRVLDSKASTDQLQDTSPLESIPTTSESTQSRPPNSTLDIPTSEATQSRPPDSMLDISLPVRQADEPSNATSDATQSRPPDSTPVISSPVRQADEPDRLPSDDIVKESSLIDSHPCRDQWPS